MTNFKKDLAIGKIYENKAMEILPQIGFTDLHLYEGYEPRFDIRGTFNNEIVYIEVKYNDKSDIFKNFIIEIIKNDFRSGGIYYSEADYYMLFSKTKYYLIEKKKLKTLIKKLMDVKTKKELLNGIKNNIKSPIYFGYYCVKIKINSIKKKSINYGAFFK